MFNILRFTSVTQNRRMDDDKKLRKFMFLLIFGVIQNIFKHFSDKIELLELIAGGTLYRV